MQDRDETDNFFQKYDPELVKDELRPIVFEEIRQQVGDQGGKSYVCCVDQYKAVCLCACYDLAA